MNRLRVTSEGWLLRFSIRQGPTKREERYYGLVYDWAGLRCLQCGESPEVLYHYEWCERGQKEPAYRDISNTAGRRMLFCNLRCRREWFRLDAAKANGETA